MRKYAIISDGLYDIKLSNSKTHRPFCEILLINYKINKDKTEIVGEEIVYKFNNYDIDINKIDETEIQEKHFLFWKWKNANSGWVKMKKIIKNSTYKNSKGFRIIEYSEIKGDDNEI